MTSFVSHETQTNTTRTSLLGNRAANRKHKRKSRERGQDARRISEHLLAGAKPWAITWLMEFGAFGPQRSISRQPMWDNANNGCDWPVSSFTSSLARALKLNLLIFIKKEYHLAVINLMYWGQCSGFVHYKNYKSLLK